jgi:hypothetical protein
MSELRYRRPDEATAVKADSPQRQDSPYQQARHTERQADTHSTRDNSDGYDADAEFKHPVPKPPSYPPDDSERTVPSRDSLHEYRAGSVESAQRNNSANGADFARQSDREAPWLRETAEDDRGENLRAVVDRPDFSDPTDNRTPDRYGDPLTLPDGNQTLCFGGPPSREQTRQGWAGDCGIIATLGAVAAYKPGDIVSRIRLQEDGSYQVTLSEAREHGGITKPTGRDIELTITPEVPVYDDNPSAPACAKAEEGTAWCPLYEKAFAGIDQTWTAERQRIWEGDWANVCARDQADNVEHPRSGPAPTGYTRINQGTSPWDRAELLTQLTGKPAVVSEFPNGQDEWRINRIIRDQLTDAKPFLVSSRSEAYEDELLPHNLEAGHVYEVTGVEKGKIILRNPWNYKHPDPMEADEFARNMDPYYSTLI